MRTSVETKNISAALFQFQMNVVQPHKNEVADTGKFKYEYITLQALKEHIKPLMEKCGLVFFSCGLTSRLTHVDSGEWIEGDFVCDVAGLDAQKCGAVGSYARRYNLQGLLDICAEEDDDAASALPAKAQPAKKAAPKREQPKQEVSATGNGEGSGGPPTGEGDGDIKQFTGMIAFIKEKTGQSQQGPWTKFSIKCVSAADGERWFNTFDKTLGKVAHESKNTTQTLEYVETQWNGMTQYDLQGFVR